MGESAKCRECNTGLVLLDGYTGERPPLCGNCEELVALRAQLATANERITELEGVPDMGLIEVTDKDLQSVHFTPGRVLGDEHFALHVTARAPNQSDITVRMNARQVSRLFRAAMAEVQHQLAAANEKIERTPKPHPKYPACHGSGTFQASDEGGMWVDCDCAANMYRELKEANEELAQVRVALGNAHVTGGSNWPLGERVAEVMKKGREEYEARLQAEQKAATAVQDFIHGRNKLCLVCGAKEPCHLKDTSTPPCTFEPSPLDLLQIHRDLRAKLEQAERALDEAAWETAYIAEREARLEAERERDALNKRADAATAAESCLNSLAYMLGWMNGVPPQETFERDVKALLVRCASGEKERDVVLADNAKLRRLCAYRRAQSVLDVYSDDGELHDNRAQPFIDWKRDPIDEIERKLMERARAALADAPDAQKGGEA